jgi:hypothetical protein
MSSIGAAVAAFAALEAITRPFGRRRSRQGGDDPPATGRAAARDGARPPAQPPQPLRPTAPARVAAAE